MGAKPRITDTKIYTYAGDHHCLYRRHGMLWCSCARYKSGTNRITQHHPTSTNINRRLRRYARVPATKALVDVVSAALQQTQHDQEAYSYAAKK
jgi:hypothetical protein